MGTPTSVNKLFLQRYLSVPQSAQICVIALLFTSSEPHRIQGFLFNSVTHLSPKPFLQWQLASLSMTVRLAQITVMLKGSSPWLRSPCRSLTTTHSPHGIVFYRLHRASRYKGQVKLTAPGLRNFGCIMHINFMPNYLKKPKICYKG